MENSKDLSAKAVPLSEIAIWLCFAIAWLLPLLKLDEIILAASSGDEAIILAGAERIVRGEIPYRDFGEILGPGSFYLLAAAFKLFGVSLFTARAMLWLTHGAILLGFILIAKTLHFRRDAILLGIAVLFGSGVPYWGIVSHHWFANAFLLGSLWMLAHSGSRQWGQAWLLGAGALASATALTLQDQGVYWILAASTALAVGPKEGRWRRLALFWAGVSMVAAPMGAYLLWRAGLQNLWHFLVESLFKYYPEKNSPSFWKGFSNGWELFLRARGFPQGLRELFAPAGLALLAADWLVLGSLIGTAVLVAKWVVARLRRQDPCQEVLLLCAAWVALVGTALHRPAMLNFTWAAAGPLLVGGWLVSSPGPWTTFRFRRTLLWAISVPFVVLGLYYTVVWPLGFPSGRLNFPRGTVFAYESDLEPLRIVQNLGAKLVEPGQSLYCYHNCHLYYFLLGLSNPTYADGYTQGREDDVRLLEELDRDPPDWVLWDRGGNGNPDPIIVWMNDHYRIFTMSSKLYVLKRNGLTSAGTEGSAR